MQGIEVKEQRPSYVVFERRPVEDRAASLQNGRFMTKDVDFAIITPIGSKDRISREVTEWFTALEQNVREERIPANWLPQYRAAYDAWKKGEEIPLNGTPIKGWTVLSPSQQANVIGADIRTVEDLAQVSDEAMRRIGMGALELRDKAQAWLKAAAGPGIAAQEVSSLKAKNRQLEMQVKNLEETIQDLKNELQALTAAIKSSAKE